MIYEDVRPLKTLKISYPNNFDIENVNISISDHSTGENTNFLLSIDSDLGRYMKDYFDPIHVDVWGEIAKIDE